MAPPAHLLFFLSFLLLLTFSHSTTTPPQTSTYIIHLHPSHSPSTFTSSLSLSLSSPITLLYTYTTITHGFSAQLSQDQLLQLQSNPSILSILPETTYSLHTTRTPLFLGLDSSSSFNLLPQSSSSSSSSDVIIGVLDTGVWPGKRSFDDTGFGSVPSSWKGDCADGGKVKCNKKLIGAQFFAKGYEASMGPIDESKEEKSPVDSDGHGTHTSTTAGGSAVEGASLLGYANGTARGMAPTARVAVYKVALFTLK